MQMRIAGKEEPAENGEWILVHNPATGELVDRVPAGGAGDIDRAVTAAEKAQPAWAQRSIRERGKTLARGAGMLRDQADALAKLLVHEQGKPLREATDEIRGCANVFEFYAGIAAHPPDEFINVGAIGDCIARHVPLGVCAAIIPWNVPAILTSWKTAPALLTGNTVVLRPSSTAPLTVLSIAAVLEKAGLPPGALNVVTGTGEESGMALVRHKRVQKVSFTGSTETGQAVLAAAQTSSKRVALELGGSDPMIVWKDADLEKAVQGAVHGRFYNAGQTCTAVKRLYLHQQIADQFLRMLTGKVTALRVGNGLSPGVDMGPLHTRAQRERVLDILDRSSGSGEVTVGGGILSGGIYDAGYFLQPTLIKGVEAQSPLLTEEVFGPVLPVMTFGDLDEAIASANASRYGLGASVWTRDWTVAERVFREVQAGLVWMNRNLTVPPEVPFGGMKESGSGRENGYQALRQYSQIRSFVIGR
ncbi:MAG: aldehyde dehydrogenase family protein [Methanomicrobiales archaeon]|nr:aldehyde dehydrogenase family protein [Methanomicrobiales archaeon]